ncbi:hypothetical protein QJS10_CPB15g00495 [Acorus calamus]|uniref:Uncharacterized protein n=1 Tax=Acorus calamus TaxID=4465 RepID=A0AAV9DBD2_ACOCL|nr:hypothetical protein QJS10_CPB15g00495 [Acorus calamus]
MDALISSFNASEMLESGPLILAWAVFLRLILSLPEEEEYNILKEIDHIGYARQSIEARSLEFLFDILCNDILMDPDGPVSGFLSVLRTFISSFVASYDMTHQFIDNSTNVILISFAKFMGERRRFACNFGIKIV